MERHQTFVIEDDACHAAYRDALIAIDLQVHFDSGRSACIPRTWNLVTSKGQDDEVYIAMWTKYRNVALFHGSREDPVSDMHMSAIESCMDDQFSEWVAYPCSDKTVTLFAQFAVSGMVVCSDEYEAFAKSMEEDMSVFDYAVSDNLTIWVKEASN